MEMKTRQKDYIQFDTRGNYEIYNNNTNDTFNAQHRIQARQDR